MIPWIVFESEIRGYRQNRRTSWLGVNALEKYAYAVFPVGALFWNDSLC